MFVAQSTGGLLVKNVLLPFSFALFKFALTKYCEYQVITQSQDGCDQGAVAACLRGVIFLDTPHRWDGSDSKAISSLLKKLGIIGQSLPKQPNLKHSKKILQTVTATFSELIRAKGDDVILWSFSENEPMPSIGLVSYLIMLIRLALTFLCWKGCGQIHS